MAWIALKLTVFYVFENPKRYLIGNTLGGWRPEFPEDRFGSPGNPKRYLIGNTLGGWRPKSGDRNLPDIR